MQEKADPETARLHVGHLTRNVEASHVQEMFGSFGTLKVGPRGLSRQSSVLHAPDMYGRGAGTALLELGMHDLDHQGCSRLCLLPENRLRFLPGAGLHRLTAVSLHWSFLHLASPGVSSKHLQRQSTQRTRAGAGCTWQHQMSRKH